MLALLAPAGTGAQQGAAGGLSLGSPVAVPSSVVTLDQERLFNGSLYGRRVAREIENASQLLARENRALESALAAEERSLTERRPSLPAEEFRALADAFDEKVVGTRSTQDAKARALTRRADLERQAFISRVVPVLSQILADRGALVILDSRAVFLAADGIDITEEALARIDAEIGEGVPLPSDAANALPEPADSAPDSPQPADPDGGGIAPPGSD